MGLDGISINQLRITPDHNSNELNKTTKFTLENEPRPVDGLSQGQRVDPDKEHEHEKRELKQNFSDEDESNDEQDEQQEDIIKYDLSQTDKYVLKLEESTNTILIIEKHSKKVIQKVSADNLSRFVNFLSNPQGSIINRKF